VHQGDIRTQESQGLEEEAAPGKQRRRVGEDADERTQMVYL